MFPRDLSEILQRKINRTALDCFRFFMLRDYGRVDMRADPNGIVHVLEINANPCISPDAGFPAALAQGEISYEAFVEQLLEFVRNRKKRKNVPYRRENPKLLTANSAE